MKHTLLLLCALTPSCARYSADPATGRVSFTVVATDFDKLSVSPTELYAEKVNQSKSTMSAIRTIGTIGTTAIVNGMLETVNANAAAVDMNASNNAAAGVLAKESTKQVGINADAAVESLKIVTP